jgi:homoserine kinase type II
MAALTTLTPDDAHRLSRLLDLGQVVNFAVIPQGSVNSNHVLETGRGRFFVRIYEERGLAEAEADVALAKKLSARGVPTPPPIEDAEGRALFLVRTKAAAVFPWIEGHMICQAGVTEAHARAVGAALAKMHLAARDIDVGKGRFRIEDIRARLGAIEDPSYRHARVVLETALSDHRRAAGLPRGLTHGDLFRDNVLWNGGNIAALLDFESASNDVLVYDLAVTILAWCYGSRFEPDLVAAMIAGYESVRVLDVREREALHTEACIACVRFATTRITDYAMRGGNNRAMKDYRRFLDRLADLERGVALFA